jgi:nucleotide-binding universal stress UspA family protein
MKKIIAATDFSAAATNAALYATDMALSIGANLLLVHIWQLPVSYGEMPMPITEKEIMEGAKQGMDTLEQQLISKSKGKINISTKLRMGGFFEELEAICDAIKPYAVLMGSQGTTAAERTIFGGHTVHAMKNLHWPLIAVPTGTVFSSIKKIGLACDFNNVDETIPVDEIKLLVKNFNASLHILNTRKKESFDPDIVFQSGALQQMVSDLKPTYHFITHEDADEGIMDFAEKNNIDLLIVFPKHHSLIGKLVYRSHTKNLVLHSHVPVMALHQ